MIDIRTDRLKLVPFGEGSNRSVNENNCKIDIPENIINNEINFLICNTCFGARLYIQLQIEYQESTAQYVMMRVI